MDRISYTITDFMAVTGLKSRQCVYNEINSGRLRTFKVGRRRLISESAAREWAEAREAETSQVCTGRAA